MTEKDIKEDYVLPVFKAATIGRKRKGTTFPNYIGFEKLGNSIIHLVSVYYVKMHLNDEDFEERAIDDFFKDYEAWALQKEAQERVNTLMKQNLDKVGYEPIVDTIIDGIFSYFDGEVNYDGNSLFNGDRERYHDAFLRKLDITFHKDREEN